MINKALAARFWSKVNRGNPAACWDWTASKSKKGYGWFRMGAQPTGAHRVAWVIARGKIPAGLCVCHRCDNPACCNPAHLFLATNHGNVLDSVRKGRHKFQRSGLKGSEIHTSKLNAEQVLEIRGAYPAQTARTLGRRFGVSHQSILAIIKREHWKHI